VKFVVEYNDSTRTEQPASTGIRQPALIKRSPPGHWGKLGSSYKPTANLASTFRKDDIFVLIDVMVR
jgi:hypothetical protein